MRYPIFEPSNYLCKPRRNSKIIQFFNPLRIITLITWISLFSIFDIHPDSAGQFMYGFFAIFGGSYFFEAILYSHRFRTGLDDLHMKYTQMLPIEFVGFAVFALVSFFPNDAAVFWEGVKTTVIIFGLSSSIAIYHKYAAPRLNKIQLSEQTGFVAFVGAIVLFVFVWAYAFLTAIEHIRV